MACLESEAGKIQFIHQNSCRWYNAVVYDNNYRGIVETKDEGDRISKLMLERESNRIIMMGNHGVTTVAPTAAEAITDLYYLEAFAKVQVLALSAVGGDVGKLRHLRKEVVEFTNGQYRTDPYFFAEKLFEGWRRSIEIVHSDYKQ